MEPNPTINGKVEALPNAQAVIDKFLAEELAAIESKTATPAVVDAVPPVQPEPTQAEPSVLSNPEPLVQTQVVGSTGQPSVSTEPAPPSIPAVKTEQLVPKFELPRIMKIGSRVKYRASGGSVYEVLKKSGGYRITQGGVEDIRTIPKYKIELLGQEEGWVRIEANTKAASVTSGEPSKGQAPDVDPAQPAGSLQVTKAGTEPLPNQAATPESLPSVAVEPKAPVEGVVEASGFVPGQVWEKSRNGKVNHKIEIVGFPDEGKVKILDTTINLKESNVKEKTITLKKLESQIAGGFSLREMSGADPVPVSQAQGLSPDAAVATLKADLIEPDTLTTVPTAEPLLQAPVATKVEAVPAADPVPAAIAVATGEALPGKVEVAPSIEPAVSPVVEATPDMITIDARITALREKVSEARTTFITAEESQASTWKKLMQTFRTLRHKESDDRELHAYQSAYDQAVLALQAAELEKLKQSGLSVKELHPEMALLIREFQFDEAERIYDERRRQRLEKTHQPLSEKLEARWKETIGSLEAEAESEQAAKWKAYAKFFLGASAIMGGAAVQGIEKLGAANNEFSKKYGKYLLTATVTVGGAVALGAATGGVASMAIGALALKRLAAGAGVAVFLEGSMNTFVDSRRTKKRANAEEDQFGLFQKMGDAEEVKEFAAIAKGEEGEKEIDLTMLEAFLKDEASKIRKGEGARRRNALLRKSGAILAGVVLGSGALSHYAHEIFGDKVDAVVAPTADTGATATVPDTAVTPSEATPPGEPVPVGAAIGGPTGGEIAPGSAGTEIAGPPAPDMTGPATTVAAPVEQGANISAKTKDFIASYEVQRGDNIWKLAERAVKDVPDMDKRASERFAKLVELKLQEKLNDSPDLARAAGFVAGPDGQLSPNYIQAGAKLEIGKLIPAEEMTKLIEEAKGATPIEVPTSSLLSTAETPTVGKSSGSGLRIDGSKTGLRIPSDGGIDPSPSRLESVVVSPEAVDGVVELRPEAELLSPTGNVMTYVEGLPADEQKKLFRNFRHVTDVIFQTDEVMNAEGYDRNFNPIPQSELAKAKLATVLSDHDALSKNPFSSYDRVKNPLHWSQMESVAKLAKASGRAFGPELARTRAGETIQEYVLRMVALTGSEGKKIPGFRMVN